MGSNETMDVEGDPVLIDTWWNVNSLLAVR